MIDFHSHILPKIDDGARNIDETNKMIEEAKIAGFTDIIATSHYIEGYYTVDAGKRMNLINEINTKISTNDNNTSINLVIGNEAFMSENLIKLIKENKISTINNTKYLLFEIPLTVTHINIDILIDMIKENGYIPILAHPERYLCVQEKPEIIPRLIKKGVLMQCNYGSIIGMYGIKPQILMTRFLESNMVHFLGTDAHKSDSIYKNVYKSKAKIIDIIGKRKFEKISKINPSLVIQNEEIEKEEIKKLKFKIREKIKMKSN